MKKGQSHTLTLFIAISLLIVGLITLFFAMGGITGNSILDFFKTCEDVEVPYNTTETYIVTEPSISNVCDDVKLKYVDEGKNANSECIHEICDKSEQYCVEKNFWGNCVDFKERCVHEVCLKYKKHCSVEIQNIDDTAGTWEVDGYFWDGDLNKKGEFIKTIPVYVKPTKSSFANWVFIYNAGESKSCRYGISKVPTKKICDDVTKYEEVERTKVITDYRIEQVCK